MCHILTFDLGTTYFKACVFDAQGHLLALAREATPIEEPAPGRREIAADALIRSVASLVEQLRAADAAAVEAVGDISFATQTNSFILLDGQDRPLTPVILWNDQRAKNDASQPQWLPPDPSLQAETGLARVGYQMAIAKVRWIQTHEPDIWQRTARLCLISDYVTWWLTGRFVTEAGASGLTALLNVHTLTWRPTLRHAMGMTSVRLSEPCYAGTDLGPIRPDIAKQLGLSPKCRFIVGCLDQYAGAIGVGNVEAGGISETTGTVLATVALNDTFAHELPPNVIQGPAWRSNLWWRMSFGGVSANLFEALQRNEPDQPSYDQLGQEAAEISDADLGDLRLDPQVSVEQGRPVFQHLQPSHTRGHRVRALFEGVAEALRRQVEHVGRGSPTVPIRSAGGAARSDLWLQIKADRVGRPFCRVECPEPTSLGAAVLALSARSAGDPAATARSITRLSDPINPNPHPSPQQA